MKDKVIIIDGPDCTGKSTLCNSLQKVYTLPVYHLSWFPDDNAMIEQFENAAELIRKGGVILDRYIFSNIAYGNVYHGGKCVYGWENYLNGNLLKDAEIIISLPRDKERYLDFYRRRFNERDEMYSEISDRIYNEYQRIIDEYGYMLNIKRFDLFDVMDAGKPMRYEPVLKDGKLTFVDAKKPIERFYGKGVVMEDELLPIFGNKEEMYKALNGCGKASRFSENSWLFS